MRLLLSLIYIFAIAWESKVAYNYCSVKCNFQTAAWVQFIPSAYIFMQTKN